MTSLLELERFSVGFRQGRRFRPILDEVDLVLPRGEFLLLLGPSGGGKSTVIDALLHDTSPLGNDAPRDTSPPRRRARARHQVPRP